MDIDYYSDEKWGAFPARTILENREKISLNWMGNVAPKGKVSVVDLGCGDGFFLSHVSQRFPAWSCSGTDGAEAMLKKAKSRIPSGKFEVADFGKRLPFADSSFDIAFAGEVIEHLNDPDFFLKECVRILKPGGHLLLTTPNLVAWYNRILILLGTSPLFVEYSSQNSKVGYGFLKGFMASSMPVGHLRIFHPNALLESLSLAGFTKVKLKSARFEAFPRFIAFLDGIVSRIWKRGGSIMVTLAQKPAQ